MLSGNSHDKGADVSLPDARYGANESKEIK